jgi:hypothetical protein
MVERTIRLKGLLGDAGAQVVDAMLAVLPPKSLCEDGGEVRQIKAI